MNSENKKFELDRLIPPEIKNDEFYTAIQRIVKEENIKTVLEIGSSSGTGSTEAFVRGIRENPNKPTLFCMEVSKTRFAELQKNYANEQFVKCYNLSSVSLKDFPHENEVIEFYSNIQSNLKSYPLEQVLNWLQQDREYVKNAGVRDKGIQKIKEENNIDLFDAVLIDGSEFTGNAELKQVYGASIIFLDDINTFKNFNNHQRLLIDKSYKLLAQNNAVRNGYSIFKKANEVDVFNFEHEKAEQLLVSNLVKAGMIVFDIGANVGDYSLLLSKLVCSFGKVYSFEPTSSTFQKLQERIVSSGVSNISAFQKAVFSENTILEFNEFPDEYSVWNSLGRPQMLDPNSPNNLVPIVKTELVETITIESFCKDYNIEKIDYLKIDVEGAESDVLQGARQLLENKAIRFIQFEISQKMLEGLNRQAKDTFDILINNGYECHRISADGKIDQQISDSEAFYENYIAFIELPVHFFTIVLNGEPFIRHHIEVLNHLPFKWHWHIIEGVANLKHDTAWSLKLGGTISDEIHHKGRSKDGTTEYLDELARRYPGNITVYRKPEGVFWDGKIEMVNAPLVNIKEECLLWQLDVDELWTIDQLCTARHMFIEHPEKTAAFYWCWYFVGENLVISTRNCYAQNPQQDWLRTWRYKPGAVWATHEPPILVEPLPNEQWRNVAGVNPFLHEETEEQGLIFQHFAYVTPEQLQFKEQYYGYKNALSQWTALQEQTQFPILLRQYFPWVRDATMVDTANSCGVIPIAQKEKINNSWQFIQLEEQQKQSVKAPILPKFIVDGVFFQLYQTGIARVWKSLLEEWVTNSFSEHIIVLDRGGTAPAIPGIKYRLVPPYNYESTNEDREILQQICDEEEADVFISTYYTTPLNTPSVFMAYDMIPEVLGANLEEPMWREKHYAIQQASAYIAISENTARDLVKFFPNLSPGAVTVAHCGVNSTFSPASLEEVNNFRIKYGISKPYFIGVGTGGGYKNTVFFLKAFAQLYSKNGFDIVFTGSGSFLGGELRAYTSGTAVHMLQLSDDELKAAYSGAVALVYPSVYEGFGLPIIEALACGCPVITCPNASIPEVAGEAVIYVNDRDVEGLANALCEVQKPLVRQSIISEGLEQAKKFSWTNMAQRVSSALIRATLLPLNLKDINLVIFPDWTQAEEELSVDLERVLKAIATHPNRSYITLLLDINGISQEDANLFLSGVAMNLLMQEDLDITEEAEISLVGHLGKLQWEALLPRLHARILLSKENEQAIAQAKVETLPSYQIDSLHEQEFASFFLELSNKLFQQRRWQEAADQYQKLLQTQTCKAELYWRLSECFRHLICYKQAASTLQEGIRLHPTDGNLHFSLIINLQTSGRIQEAISSATTASSLLPNDYTFKILKNLLVPIVYDTEDEISFYRQRFANGLQNLIQQTSLETPGEQKNALAGIGRFTNFYLAHQEQNDKELQRQYGSLVHKIMATNYPNWLTPLSMPPILENHKIRIGYVSAYLHSYSGTLWLTGWLSNCNHESFEIYCYYIGNEPDPITQQFQKYSDKFQHIPHNLEAACQQIIADELHILVFPEIGMNPQTLQMAALRLAPVQCVAWGHPVTPGLPTIDYFLSSELMEPENAQNHYSETLIRLPNIGVSYPKPYIPPTTKNRADFQLRDDAVIYLCCQAPFKYLPQYDFILAEIAHRVPQAQFLFLRGGLLKQRLNRAFAAVGLKSEDYCVFLTIPERLDYLTINLLSDVYLDTFSWSGGNTTLEAIACNLPIVTCPGEFMRGRHSDSFLKMLGVTDTIAQNEAEYIEIAVKLGLDPALRNQLAERMRENQDRLYDDKACVVGLEAFYKQIVEERCY